MRSLIITQLMGDMAADIHTRTYARLNDGISLAQVMNLSSDNQYIYRTGSVLTS